MIQDEGRCGWRLPNRSTPVLPIVRFASLGQFCVPPFRQHFILRVSFQRRDLDLRDLRDLRDLCLRPPFSLLFFVLPAVMTGGGVLKRFM